MGSKQKFDDNGTQEACNQTRAGGSRDINPLCELNQSRRAVSEPNHVLGVRLLSHKGAAYFGWDDPNASYYRSSIRCIADYGSGNYAKFIDTSDTDYGRSPDLRGIPF